MSDPATPQKLVLVRRVPVGESTPPKEPPAPPGPPAPPTGPRPPLPPVERRKMLRMLTVLMARGLSNVDQNRILKKRFGLGSKAVERHRRRIYEQWAAEDDERRPYLKARQLARLHRGLDKAYRTGQWTAISALERLIAQIEGNLDPVKLQVNVAAEVQNNVLRVIHQMSPEQLAEYADKERAFRGHAQLAEPEMTVEPDDAEIVMEPLDLDPAP